MLARMWSDRNAHSLPVGIQKSTATLENSSVIPYKAELILKPTIQQLHLLVLSQQAENISTQNPAHNYITLIEDINNKEAVLEQLFSEASQDGSVDFSLIPSIDEKDIAFWS